MIDAWKIIGSPNDPEMYAVGGPYLVADILPIEDARLIAAAPELLEALELAHATLCGANMNRAVVERKVVAAIAKARGQ